MTLTHAPSPPTSPEHAAGPAHAASPLLLQSTTPRPLPTLLPALEVDLRSAGAWIGETLHLSPTAASLDLELHRHAAPSFYSALLRSGLHLTRSAHTALACLCSRHPPFNGRALHLLLEIRLLEAHRTSFGLHLPPSNVAISA